MRSLGLLFKEEDMNIKFHGSYDLLKYIIEKYNIYNSKITQFITDNCYSISASSSWRKKDVPFRVWNIIYKDLLIMRLCGKDVKMLDELQQEFKSLK